MAEHDEYAARIERVVCYLCEHLDETLELDVLAKVACFSRYHFHRIYRSVQGETAADTVRRLRLNRAAIELLGGDVPIERIARRAGYSSQAAFTRAFRSAYGMPPARYQRQTERSARPSDYHVDIVESPRISLAAISHRGDYYQIAQKFRDLVALARARGQLHPSSRFFGIYYDDPESLDPAELRAEACMSRAEGLLEHAEVHALEIAAGHYAKISHVGPYSELEQPYTWLYRTWLPSARAEPADQPCVEEYLDDPRRVSASDLLQTRTRS
jgi:AraC family transcriptional regulator